MGRQTVIHSTLFNEGLISAVILSEAKDLTRNTQHSLVRLCPHLPNLRTHPAIGNPTITMCTPNPDQILLNENGPRECNADNGNTMYPITNCTAIPKNNPQTIQCSVKNRS